MRRHRIPREEQASEEVIEPFKPVLRSGNEVPAPLTLQPATGCSPERSIARCMTMRACPSSLLWTLIPYAQPDLVEEIRMAQDSTLERIVVCEDPALFFGEEVERAAPRGKYDRIVLWLNEPGGQYETLVLPTEAMMRAYELLAPGGKLVAVLDREAIDDASTGLRAWAVKKGAGFDQPVGAFSKLGLIQVTMQLGLRA